MKKKYTQIISGAILFVCGVCRKKSGKSVIWIGFPFEMEKELNKINKY